MRRQLWLIVLLPLLYAGAPGWCQTPASSPLPAGFVYVGEAAPDVLLEIRYYSTYNFVGARIDGYEAPRAILSADAAAALQRASLEAMALGYVLKIYDAYRPQRAVDHFVRWAASPGATANRQCFYPLLDKSELFAKNYIADKSGHSRGSTVDLTLMRRLSGRELDMGSPFDFFGPVSHHGSELVSAEQAANRALLRAIMENAGFVPYAGEWWHYTLANEPYPNSYFDFVVK